MQGPISAAYKQVGRRNKTRLRLAFYYHPRAGTATRVGAENNEHSSFRHRSTRTGVLGLVSVGPLSSMYVPADRAT